ncbi:MAG: family 78 glycoside hydrolase catalytic domain, partial [Firmicutes bacterium]|nr:family 78 glycoside hydrolase catalytic domain [Bacillota bacterium]
MKSIRLKTEYLTKPLGLAIAAPKFYWNCEGGEKQTAYQIIAKCNEKVVWDSGKVLSSAMTHITYNGEKLGSRDRVNWSVKLWDENDVSGEATESWFELGLLETTDWKASWITGDYRPKKEIRYSVDCFKKQFDTDKKIVKARLYASARGVYDVHINGKRVEDFILAPGMTDYRKRIQYQTYDVTALLQKSNTLELRLADGWYRGSSAAFGVTGVYGWQTSVMAQLEVYYEDGTTATICTDNSWDWSNDGPIRFADLKDGEVYNALMKPSYNGKAKVVEAPKVPLVGSNNVAVKEQEHLTAKVLTAVDGKRVLDFGQNIAGYLKFTVRGGVGETFRLVCGEILDENGHVNLKGIQEEVSAKRYDQMAMMIKLMTWKAVGVSTLSPLQEIRFTCSGDVDYYKTSFAIFGFQYVQIEGTVEFENIEAVAVYSDMEQTGFFECSNELVNKLYRNTLWSMKGNYLDLPTDCPTRERLGWTGDAQIFFDTGAYLMDTAAFFRKWIQDIEDAQLKNGLLPAVLPYQGLDMMYNNTGSSVGWADAIYLIPYRHYRRFGDKTILEHFYSMMKKYVDYLLAHLGMKDKKEAKANPYNAYTYEKGMHLGEWLEPEEFQEKITAGKKPKHSEEATAYLHLTMKTMAKIATLLGKSEEARTYTEYAEGTKKAYNYLFVKTGTLNTNRQAKIVRPLALGLLDGEDKKIAQQKLVKAVRECNYHVGTGFLSTSFLLSVLTEAGETETAYKMLENTEKPGWLYEILDGATTIWENWEGTASRNHYSTGAVCQCLFDTIAGICPDGENCFIIH